MQSQWGKSSEAPPPLLSPQGETPVALPGLKRTFEAERNPGPEVRRYKSARGENTESSPQGGPLA
jgi:hypothetical protein